VVVIGTMGLVLWSLLAAPALRRAADGSPLGMRRTAALTVLRPLSRFSGWLGIARVAGAAESALGRERTPGQPVDSIGIPPPEGLASPGPSPAAPGSPSPSASASPTSRPTPAASVGTASIPVPPPTTERRLRVLIVGDSIGADLAIGLSRLLYDRGNFVLKTDAREATGLARPDYFDWQAQVANDLRTFRPDVVVAMFGANDNQSFLAGGEGYVLGSPEWRRIYSHRVGGVMSEVTASGRPVVWVGMPPMKSGSLSGTMRMLNGIFRTEAVRHPGSIYVESWTSLADTDGAYTAYLPNRSGDEELVRQPDGVHLTAAGSVRLGSRVFQEMRVLWRGSPGPAPSISPQPVPAPTDRTGAGPGSDGRPRTPSPLFGSEGAGRG